MSSKSELLRHVINQFLDEQEALYNKMDYASDIILEMKDRDHIVFTYNNESQFKEIVNAYVRRGIDRNQINVLPVLALGGQYSLGNGALTSMKSLATDVRGGS